MIQPSEESADFKNSLASLLSKGNPLAPGVQRRQTIQPKKQVEEDQPKDKIKFDIFNQEEETTDYMAKSVIDNDDALSKPVMLKANKTTKKYDFFDDDE